MGEAGRRIDDKNESGYDGSRNKTGGEITKIF